MRLIAILALGYCLVGGCSSKVEPAVETPQASAPPAPVADAIVAEVPWEFVAPRTAQGHTPPILPQYVTNGQV